MCCWRALLKANKRSRELRPNAGQWTEVMQFCYRDVKKMFVANGVACGPHLVGNKMRFEKVRLSTVIAPF